MLSNFRFLIFGLIFFVTILSSCVSSKQIVYLNNLADSANARIDHSKTDFDDVIQKNDLLAISIGGSNPDDLVMLNSGSGVLPGASVGNNFQKSIGYLVESDGQIQFPFLGRVQAAGLTRVQLEDSLTKQLMNYTKNPVVNVKFLNYSYSVLGEVTHPGRYEMDNERTTIFDALGSASDLTVYGKRNNVLVIREVNGKREFGRIDLLSKNIFNSPFFYLKTHDVIYVEPVKSKFFVRSGLPQYVGIAAAGVTLLLTLFNLSKL